MTISATAFAYTELPFCPGDGSPGWINYFDYKRGQNDWQQYRRGYYTPAGHLSESSLDTMLPDLLTRDLIGTHALATRINKVIEDNNMYRI